MYIDNIKFAQEHGELSGILDLQKCNKIQEFTDNISGEIKYRLQGIKDNLNRPALSLSICGIIATLCQNCLDPMTLSINHNSIVTIFDNEDDLDLALFGENKVDDGIVSDIEFDVIDFLEDELILLIPVAPRHLDCTSRDFKDSGSNPFSSLKNLIG